MNRMWNLIAIMVALLLPTITSAQPSTSTARPDVTIQMNPRPSPYLSDWEQRHETVRLSIVNRSNQPMIARVDARITRSNSVMASTNVDAMPALTLPPGITTLNAEQILPASAMRIAPGVRTEAIRSGMLPAGDYELCVRLLPLTSTTPLADEKCAPFTLTAYQAPIALQPVDGDRIVVGRDRPMFRWTPVTPMPNEPVRYRLKIYESLATENRVTSLQATSVATNAPLFQAEVDATTALPWPTELSTAHAGSYLWTVEAMRADGTPIGTMLGVPRPHGFTLCEGDATVSGSVPLPFMLMNDQDENCQHTRKTETEWGDWNEDADGTRWRVGKIFTIDECTMGRHAATRTQTGTIKEVVKKNKTTITTVTTNSDGGTTTTVEEKTGDKTTKKTTTVKDAEGNTKSETVEEGGKATTTTVVDGTTFVTVTDKDNKVIEEWKFENGKWYKKVKDVWKEQRKGPGKK